MAMVGWRSGIWEKNIFLLFKGSFNSLFLTLKGEKKNRKRFEEKSAFFCLATSQRFLKFVVSNVLLHFNRNFLNMFQETNLQFERFTQLQPR